PAQNTTTPTTSTPHHPISSFHQGAQGPSRRDVEPVLFNHGAALQQRQSHLYINGPGWENIRTCGMGCHCFYLLVSYHKLDRSGASLPQLSSSDSACASTYLCHLYPFRGIPLLDVLRPLQCALNPSCHRKVTTP